MPISSLGIFLLIALLVIATRMALFKVFKPHAELPSLPVESVTSQADGEIVSQASGWPVVVLLCVVVFLVMGLMVFGNAIGG